MPDPEVFTSEDLKTRSIGRRLLAQIGPDRYVPVNLTGAGVSGRVEDGEFVIAGGGGGGLTNPLTEDLDAGFNSLLNVAQIQANSILIGSTPFAAGPLGFFKNFADDSVYLHTAQETPIPGNIHIAQRDPGVNNVQLGFVDASGGNNGETMVWATGTTTGGRMVPTNRAPIIASGIATLVNGTVNVSIAATWTGAAYVLLTYRSGGSGARGILQADSPISGSGFTIDSYDPADGTSILATDQNQVFYALVANAGTESSYPF